MIPATRIADLDAVDAFLLMAKALDGPPPIWRVGSWGGEYTASWNVLDDTGSPVAQLRCTSRQANTSVAAMNLIYRGNPIWRVDVDDPSVCHDNPHNAYLQNLPPIVCGPHEHAWPINRDHLMTQDAWTLPYRRQVAVRRLAQALPLLADQINLTLTPEQRTFDGPTRADLFDLSGQ
jgi:hypothetical protein